MQAARVCFCVMVIGVMAAAGSYVLAADHEDFANCVDVFSSWPLAYETSAYELAPVWRQPQRAWQPEELLRELRRRVSWEKSRQELQVYYYRIGYTIAFPLPVDKRPDPAGFPAGIPEITYPWLTWLSWELDERWRILLAGCELLADDEAKAILQKELGNLAWENYRGDGNAVGLPTGHFAGVLALTLSKENLWDESTRAGMEQAARKLLEEDIAPWFEKNWAEPKPITSPRLHNYVLILFRAAQLARVLKHPMTSSLEARAEDVFRAWCQARKAPVYHSEGTAYDGYLLDAVTEWIEGLPAEKHRELVDFGQAPLVDFCRQAIALCLPGRVDLQAPLGDVEPEMAFWATVLARLARWYEIPEACWLLKFFPPSRFRAEALRQLVYHSESFGRDFPAPSGGAREQMASVSLRTGFWPSDCLVAVGLPRCQMGHLHPDAGQVVIGWQGRFWVTDPGYQQYRRGEERVYTLGPRSHNLPVVGGVAASKLAGQLLELGEGADELRAAVDITPAYSGLGSEGRIVRTIVLRGKGPSYTVTVSDHFKDFAPGTEVIYHWLGGAYLAWAFREGWARLSDGKHSLWIACGQAPIMARHLDRHPGSRGPLTLAVPLKIEDSSTTITWSFHLVPGPSWTPPK